MKRKLTATCPDGTVFTRQTDHDYKFVVVALVTDKGADKPHWGSIQWSSRLDLAEKTAQTWRGHITGLQNYYGEIWHEIRIISVDITTPDQPIDYSADDGSQNRQPDDITPDPAGDAVAPEAERPLDALRVAWNCKHIMSRLYGTYSDKALRMAAVFDAFWNVRNVRFA